MSEFVRIPLERVGALIGPRGEAKKEIERRTRTRIRVDSESGDVEVEAEDGLAVHRAANIVKAIGRGFAPEKALALTRPDVYLEIVDLTESLGKSGKALEQKRARIIGTKGKAREEIEAETGACVSVYGKTIALIGREEEIERAAKAVEMFVEGASHLSVYDYLKKKGKEKRFEL